MFVQVEQSLLTHRKTIRLARALVIDRCSVVGRLVMLWSWALDNAPDGVLAATPQDVADLADVLAEVMCWTAEEGEPSHLLDGLVVAGFIDVDESAQDTDKVVIILHDWRGWVDPREEWSHGA